MLFQLKFGAANIFLAGATSGAVEGAAAVIIVRSKLQWTDKILCRQDSRKLQENVQYEAHDQQLVDYFFDFYEPNTNSVVNDAMK